MKKPSNKNLRHKTQSSTETQINLLTTWIESQKPDPGTNPLSAPALPTKAPIGKLPDGSYSVYAGCRKFEELPISEETKKGLKEGKFKSMSEVQVACLPHAICGRDVLGAAKTGSGKTLAFVIPVLEKLYRGRWGREDGVGCIILSPTRELAGQIFDVLKSVGKHHTFSAGLLIGGGTNLDTEREHVSDLNILVCTPGRLLQHMDETPNFDCSQLQILVLDEADRILDVGFKKALNAIISQLPRHRQTLLFSATQTKSVQDLARLSLKDPEYISVHEESVSATPSRLHQTAIVVPLDQKLDMLWSFIKAHLNSRILVFLSSCKQVKFVFEAFKKLRPGIPLKCLHGRMKQHTRMGIYTLFSEEKRSVLLSTDVASRGLDFNKAVDWVVQVDCPENVAAYIHRVGRTARYQSTGKSVLFLMPSEMKMLEKLEEKKVPVQFMKTNMSKVQPISKMLASLLAQSKGMPDLAKRAFITYLKSIYLQKDKEIFDVTKLPIEEYSLSLGLPLTPKIRFLKRKTGSGDVLEEDFVQVEKRVENTPEPAKGRLVARKSKEDEGDEIFFVSKKIPEEGQPKAGIEVMPEIRSLNKKKLKINVHRPVGTRVVFDDGGDTLAPLATLAETQSESDTVLLDKKKVLQRYAEEREALEQEDEEDKRLDRKRRKELRKKQKMKMKRGRQEEEDDDVPEDELSESQEEGNQNRSKKKSKIYYNSDSDGDEGKRKRSEGKAGNNGDAISLAEQEALALTLLNTLHS